MSRGIMAELAASEKYAINGHESRIQRLETLAISTSAAIAQQSSQLDAIGKQMVMSLDNVAGKVDQLSCNVTEKINDLSLKVQTLDSEADSSNSRISLLESGTKGKFSESVRRFVRKFLGPFLAAAGAGLATYLVQHFLR